MKIPALIGLISLSLIVSGCAAPQQRTQASTPTPKQAEPRAFKPIEFQYDPAIAEPLNFARQLSIPVFQCELLANTGGYAVRLGNQQSIAESSDILNQCHKRAYSQANEAVDRLKAAKVPARQAELSKDLYAKWSTFIDSLSVYERTDQRAKAAYDAAAKALAAEVKFSQ